MSVKVILHGQDKFQTTDLSGILKGSNGEIVTAIAGADYVVPSALNSYVPTSRKVNGKTLISDIVIGANDITFADGQTFQEKCDNGTLQGPPGTPGTSGGKGEKGDPGPNIVSTTTATNINGLIKGNGSNIQLAVAGTDYVLPSGNITGNAATATKLATKRTISLTGATVGKAEFDGTANATIATTRRGCLVMQSANSSTNPWYKFASISISSANTDELITFLVRNTYSSSDYAGILSVRVRTNATAGTWSTGTISWLSITSSLDPANFVMCHKETSGTKVDIELYVKIASAYAGYSFDVLSESTRNSRGTYWTLYDKSSAGDQAELPTGYTQIVSTVSTLRNSTSGNAGSATKLTDFAIGNTDLNTFKGSTYWNRMGYAVGGNSCANKPNGVNAFGLLIFRAAQGWTFQMLFRQDANVVYARRGEDAGSWQAWYQIYPTTVGTSVTGTLPIANGGTGATTAANAIKNLGGLPLAGGTMVGNIAMGQYKITGLPTPTTDTEPATKSYVDTTYMPKSGGTFTGNVSGKYFTGTWLQTTSATNLGKAPEKIPVLDTAGWLYYRTPNELCEDIGALNAAPKYIAASALHNTPGVYIFSTASGADTASNVLPSTSADFIGIQIANSTDAFQILGSTTSDGRIWVRSNDSGVSNSTTLNNWSAWQRIASVNSTVAAANKLATSRTFPAVNLAGTSSASFDGSANPTALGVTGTLPVAHGGTGATSASAALTALGGVPTSRTINGKALSGNITLGAGDIKFSDGQTFQQKLDGNTLNGATFANITTNVRNVTTATAKSYVASSQGWSNVTAFDGKAGDLFIVRNNDTTTGSEGFWIVKCNSWSSGTMTGTALTYVVGNKGATGSAGPNSVTTFTGTNITGLLKGNGTAISAAVAGTDYLTPTNANNTYLKLAGGTMSGALAMGNNKITGLATPTALTDAATKEYVDSSATNNYKVNYYPLTFTKNTSTANFEATCAVPNTCISQNGFITIGVSCNLQVGTSTSVETYYGTCTMPTNFVMKTNTTIPIDFNMTKTDGAVYKRIPVTITCYTTNAASGALSIKVIPQRVVITESRQSTATNILTSSILTNTAGISNVTGVCIVGHDNKLLVS